MQGSFRATEAAVVERGCVYVISAIKRLYIRRRGHRTVAAGLRRGSIISCVDYCWASSGTVARHTPFASLLSSTTCPRTFYINRSGNGKRAPDWLRRHNVTCKQRRAKRRSMSWTQQAVFVDLMTVQVELRRCSTFICDILVGVVLCYRR